jgi:tripartite-type tricarboxylate transporter receptor subunit TctC
MGMALAQTYPARPVTIIVPFAAGGPTDTTARLVANAMTKIIGQQMVIENVTGAGGAAGPARLAKAAPDGYTLLLHHFGFTSLPSFYKNPGYDPINSVEYLGTINSGPFLFLAKNGFPAKTLQEYVARVKADGEKIRMAHAGVGSGSYKCAIQFLNAIGAKVTFVAYRGTGPALSDLVAGHVDILCDQAFNSLANVQAGKVQAYAITALERLPEAPTIPTTSEAGLKDFLITVWHGMYAPKGTPPAVLAKLREAVGKSVEDPEIIARFKQLGTTVFPPQERTHEAHAARVKREMEQWQKLTKAIGVVPN